MSKTRIIERRCLLELWDLMHMDLFACMEQNSVSNLRSKYSEVSSKLHLVMTHIGFHVNTTPSGSGQAPNISSHLQETYGSNEQQPQLDSEA
ncbi:hypothetical protein C1H46_035948 [Malus baccata]|uniref:Uncharacterized protein n=1 Tax=Malus baccata TaxID=106549 RepID=A0A540KW84_MALBA|nr:hypothetical protein C1H46_035948 [Malus baccata]